MTDRWDPAQYHRFRNERRQPWEDLVALVEVRPDMRVVDLGCGSGELTRELAERLGAASVLGIDSSAAMLDQADWFSAGVATAQEPGAPDDLPSAPAAQLWTRCSSRSKA